MPPPLGAAPPPHIFKYCQLLDITDNNERISMKFSGISLMARRRKWVKNTKICHPLLGLPQQPQPKEEWREGEGKSGNMSPPWEGVTGGSPASPRDPLMECVLD